MSFNVWQPQGTVVPNTPGVLGNPSVIFDTNPVVLTGNTHVFKMWCCTSSATGNIYYFESVDGLTNWTAYSGNPILGTLRFVPTVFKVGSTYYLYCTENGFTGNGISVFTSTDGVTFTAQGSGNQIPIGAGGSWESVATYQPYIVVVNGTWYAYYQGYNGTTFSLGLATSTDGINWTKSPSNPIFPGPIGSGFPMQVGNTFYFWAAFFSSVSGFHNNYRTGRWSAPSPTGPWTPLTYNGIQAATYYLATATELGNGSGGYPSNGPTDGYFCVANGNIYFYYTWTAPNGSEQGINAAFASGVTPAQLVASYEGVLNVPMTGVPEINYSIVGSDTFQRADANPIAGNWTQESAIGTFGPNALVSHTMRAASLSTVNAISYWNAGSFNNDQWSKVTVSAITNTGASVFAACRLSTVGAQTFYRIGWSGAALGSSASINIQKDVAGTFTNILSISGVTLNVGDTITAVVIGSTILTYINDNLFYLLTDASLTSGPAGAETTPSTALTDAIISAWSGGNLQAAPLAPSLSSGFLSAGQLNKLFSLNSLVRQV